MQNIGADNAGDAFYRYKMPKLVAKIEGRGNGIKTNVVNNVEIAKALARPPGYVIKYFGCELGAQTKYEEALGTSIVNGAHDQKRLSEILEGFIKRYVQCYDCGNPETVLKIKKEMITLKCKACGFVSDVDPRHKLNTFILKNPPDNKLSKEEARLKKVEEERLEGAAVAAKDAEASKDKKEKKKDKDKDGKEKKDKKKKKSNKDKDGKEDDENKADGSPQDEDEDEEEDDGDGVVWMTDTSAAAVKKRAEEQLSLATAALVTVVDVEKEEEEKRRKEEEAAQKIRDAEAAAARRQAEEAAAAAAAAEAARKAAALTLDDIPAERIDVERAVELLRGFAGRDRALLLRVTNKLNVEGGLAGKMRALYEGLLPAAEGYMYKQMAELRPVFVAFSSDAQGQLAQLIALEYLLAVAVPAKLKEAAKLLETMLKNELASAEVVIAWYEKADAAKILGVPAEGAAAVRKATQPVYQILKEQEEEDSEEDSEEEDEEEEDDE